MESGKLKKRALGIPASCASTSICDVSATNSEAVSNAVNTTSHVTHYACRSFAKDGKGYVVEWTKGDVLDVQEHCEGAGLDEKECETLRSAAAAAFGIE